MFKKISYIGVFALLMLLFAAAPAYAHNGAILAGDNIVDAMSADYNDYMFPVDTVQSFILMRGHGFEYSFGNLANPFDISIIAPDGTETIVTTQTVTEEVDNNLAGTMVTMTYQKFDFKFTQKGTYFLSTSFPGNTVENVKTTVYVGDGTWSDWNRNLGFPLEFTTYTRMSGLAEGEVIYGKLNFGNGSGASDVMYYVEPLKSAADARELRDMLIANYPTGESIELIYSKRASTDEFGHFVSSIPEAGIWTLVATATYDGAPYKATYTFPVLPQFYGTAKSNENGNGNTNNTPSASSTNSTSSSTYTGNGFTLSSSSSGSTNGSGTSSSSTTVRDSDGNSATSNSSSTSGN